MNDILKGVGLTVGIGVGAVLLARQLSKKFWQKVSYSLGNPKFEISTNEANQAVILFSQPMTIKSKLKGRVTIEGYDGKVFYKNIEIGKATLTPFSVSNEAPATTTIYTEFLPEIGELIGMTINDPWEILKVIQSGLTTQGTIYLKFGKSKIPIPFKEKIFFA